MKKPYIHLGIAFVLFVFSLAVLLHGWRAAWDSGFWEKSLLVFVAVAGVAILYLVVSIYWSIVALCLRLSHKHKAMLILSLLSLLSSGCGTIMTLSSNKHEFAQNRKYIFSGVRQGYWLVFGSDAEFIHPVLKAGGIADLPFSAVADTLCLPYTIPKAISENKGREGVSNQASEATP